MLPGAHALSLGDLAVRSSVGQAFDAVLPFQASAEDAITPQCVRVNGPGDATQAADVPVLAGVRVALRERAGGGQIVLSTRTVVNEPAFRLRVTIDCGARTFLSREFVVLLDAPGTLHLPEVPAPAAAPAAVAAAPAEAVPRRRARREPGADASASPVPRAAPLPSLRVDGARSAPGARAPAARGRPRGQYRLTLSSPDLAAESSVRLDLKRADELGALGGPRRAFAAAELDELRAAARLQLSDDPIAEAARMQTRLAAVEGSMAALRQQIAGIEAARRSAEDKAQRLVEENRRLEARQGAIWLVAVLLACAALTAWLFRRYRLSAERRGHEARFVWPEEAAPARPPVPASTAARPPAPPPDTGTAPRRAPEVPAPTAPAAARPPVAAPSRPAPAAPPAEPAPVVPAGIDYQRTVVLDRAALAAAAAGDHPVRLPAARDDGAREYLPESALLVPPASASAAGSRIPTIREKTIDAPGVADGMPVMADGVDFVIDGPGGVSPADEAAGRAARYLAEFERKLFPEIALGRVKLDDPRSIIGLARTYYQEDFDPAKAISFLEYTLHRSTDPMRIHLALLEVLRLERRVGEYATVARAFRGQYPDSGTHWQLVAAYGRLLDAKDPMYDGDRVPGLDLDTPSNWLGSTLDMTKYVLGQKVADALRESPMPSHGGAP